MTSAFVGEALSKPAGDPEDLFRVDHVIAGDKINPPESEPAASCSGPPDLRPVRPSRLGSCHDAPRLPIFSAPVRAPERLIMMQLLLFNVTNGLIIGAFYVLMALGLSLILNLSNVINFAHGGFLVVGGYIAYTITPYVGFWGALLIAPPLTAIIGLVVERVLIRPLYGRDPLYSLLLTFGLAFIFEDGTRFIWGAQGKPVTVPAILAQPLSNEFFFITGYRLFMVAMVAVAVALLFVLLR